MASKLTLGSISRDQAAAWFPFLAENFRGRRRSLKIFTHTAPDFVFWIYPDGTLYDARDKHRENVPPGFAHIVDDEPDYAGFLRGRVATNVDGQQLVAVYCRSEALATSGPALDQLLAGLDQLPIPLQPAALVISDNTDIYGTVDDLQRRVD